MSESDIDVFRQIYLKSEEIREVSSDIGLIRAEARSKVAPLKERLFDLRIDLSVLEAEARDELGF